VNFNFSSDLCRAALAGELDKVYCVCLQPNIWEYDLCKKMGYQECPSHDWGDQYTGCDANSPCQSNNSKWKRLTFLVDSHERTHVLICCKAINYFIVLQKALSSGAYWSMSIIHTVWKNDITVAHWSIAGAWVSTIYIYISNNIANIWCWQSAELSMCVNLLNLFVIKDI
jgi:hypothetical protein